MHSIRQTEVKRYQAMRVGKRMWSFPDGNHPIDMLKSKYEG